MLSVASLLGPSPNLIISNWGRGRGRAPSPGNNDTSAATPYRIAVLAPVPAQLRLGVPTADRSEGSLPRVRRQSHPLSCFVLGRAKQCARLLRFLFPPF